MISKDDYNWGASVDLDKSSTALVPVEYTAKSGDKAETYKKAGSTTVNDADASEGTDYLSFDLYFKSGSTDSLNVNVNKFTLVNTSASSLPAKVKLNTTGLSGITENSYTVDMFRALNVVTVIGQTTEKLTNEATIPTPENLTRTAYNADSYKSTDSLSTEGVTYNAHQYYNAVKGLASGDTGYIDDTKTGSETTTALPKGADATGIISNWKLGETGAGSIVSTTASSVLKVTFVIYLDGWNKACFDACQNQSFTLAMEFTSSKVTNHIKYRIFYLAFSILNFK